MLQTSRERGGFWSLEEGRKEGGELCLDEDKSTLKYNFLADSDLR